MKKDNQFKFVDYKDELEISIYKDNSNLDFNFNFNLSFINRKEKLSGDFWNYIKIDRSKKFIEVINYHRLVYGKKKNIGSFILLNIEKNFSDFNLKNNFKTDIIFEDIKYQYDTKFWLEKFGYKKSIGFNKEEVYLKKLNNYLNSVSPHFPQ